MVNVPAPVKCGETRSCTLDIIGVSPQQWAHTNMPALLSTSPHKDFQNRGWPFPLSQPSFFQPQKRPLYVDVFCEWNITQPDEKKMWVKGNLISQPIFNDAQTITVLVWFKTLICLQGWYHMLITKLSVFGPISSELNWKTCRKTSAIYQQAALMDLLKKKKKKRKTEGRLQNRPKKKKDFVVRKMLSTNKALHQHSVHSSWTFSGLSWCQQTHPSHSVPTCVPKYLHITERCDVEQNVPSTNESIKIKHHSHQKKHLKCCDIKSRWCHLDSHLLHDIMEVMEKIVLFNNNIGGDFLFLFLQKLKIDR